MFGLVELMRAVYGTREGRKIKAVPLDERLQVPQGKSSYVLQDRDQGLAVEMPCGQVNTGLERILGFTESVHTLEEFTEFRIQRASRHLCPGYATNDSDFSQPLTA